MLTVEPLTKRGLEVFYSAPWIGGGERSEPIRRMLFMPYDTESKSRNADFISIAAERQSATLSAAGAVAP